MEQLINRDYIIEPYNSRETFKGTLREKLSDTMYLFDNVTKLEIIRTRNNIIVRPIRRYGTRIFNANSYFELIEDMDEGRKRRKSKKRKSIKKKSV
jgi:hypothetical protein